MSAEYISDTGALLISAYDPFPVIQGGFTDYADIIAFDALPNHWLHVCQDNFDCERELYDVLLTETYNLWGVPIIYYVASYDTSYDPIWGEDGNRRFVSAVDNIKMYCEIPNEANMWSKFGTESVYKVQAYLSKMHFDARTGGTGYRPYIGRKPQIGDVIQTIYNGQFYEITYVGSEDEMFGQDKHSWMINVSVFKDEHVHVDNSIATSDITDVTNQPTDIEQINEIINDKKEPIIYQPINEKSTNASAWGEWA